MVPTAAPRLVRSSWLSAMVAAVGPTDCAFGKRATLASPKSRILACPRCHTPDQILIRSNELCSVPFAKGTQWIEPRSRVNSGLPPKQV